MQLPILLLLAASLLVVSAGDDAAGVAEIAIISPTNEDFVSLRIPIQVSFTLPSSLFSSSSSLQADLLVNGETAQTKSFSTQQEIYSFDNILLADLIGDNKFRCELSIKINNNGQNDLVLTSPSIRPRIAVDTFIESEQGSYSMWMPPWLAANFAHLFEIDSQGRQQMPPLEQYLTLQDYMLEQPKDTILLDVGAHIGQSALPVAAAGYGVVSVEPVHSSAALLRHNAKQSGLENRISVIEAVASDSEGTQTLFVPVMQDNACLSRSGAVLNMQDKNHVREVAVPKVVLDDWLDSHPETKAKVRFVKIDTQGFEIFVLRGLDRFLRSQRPLHVLTEWDEKLMKHAQVNPQDVEQFFRERGFELVEDGGDRLYVAKKGGRVEL